MREIVRQRVRENGRVLGISLVAIVSLYVAIDAALNFDEFLQVSNTNLSLFKNMGRYYLTFIASHSVGFLGIAAIITLSIVTFRPVFRH